MNTHIPRGPGDARPGGSSQAQCPPTTATLRAADVRPDSLTDMHREARLALWVFVPLFLVCLAVVGISYESWPHFSELVRVLLFSVAWFSGLGALCVLSGYRRRRRMQRLAMAALPVTSMVMMMIHEVRQGFAAPYYPYFVHEYRADLWHREDLERRPSRSASELPIQAEEPVASRRYEPALQVPLDYHGGCPVGVDIPVTVLGTLLGRQWVLILTPTGVL